MAALQLGSMMLICVFLFMASAGEPALVSAAAALLACILVHNSTALSRLYLTGVFLFGLAYCGSNLAELAALFKVAHLVQAFRCGCNCRWGASSTITRSHYSSK